MSKTRFLKNFASSNIKVITRNITFLFLMVALIFTFTACSEKEVSSDETSDISISTQEQDETKVTTEESTTEAQPMTVTCNSITSDNKLLTKCAATYANGQNLVPSLSWTAVDGASCYAVYMIDGSANNWLHLMALTTDTSIAEGTTIDGKYIGPYPPSGTHTYTIYVFALKDNPSTLPGNFNSTNGSVNEIKSQLGTIIDECKIDVYYANGDNNEN